MRLISPCLPNLEMEVDSQFSSFLSQHFIEILAAEIY